KNLPPPDRVEPSCQNYVAWYRRGPDTIWNRVAALAYEPDTRAATLAGSVPEKHFDLEITAEPAVDRVAPSPNRAFMQRNRSWSRWRSRAAPRCVVLAPARAASYRCVTLQRSIVTAPKPCGAVFRRNLPQSGGMCCVRVSFTPICSQS